MFHKGGWVLSQAALRLCPSGPCITNVYGDRKRYQGHPVDSFRFQRLNKIKAMLTSCRGHANVWLSDMTRWPLTSYILCERVHADVGAFS